MTHIPAAYDDDLNEYSAWAMAGDFNWNPKKRRGQLDISMLSATGVEVEQSTLSSNVTHRNGAALDHVST